MLLARSTSLKIVLKIQETFPRTAAKRENHICNESQLLHLLKLLLLLLLLVFVLVLLQLAAAERE